MTPHKALQDQLATLENRRAEVVEMKVRAVTSARDSYLGEIRGLDAAIGSLKLLLGGSVFAASQPYNREPEQLEIDEEHGVAAEHRRNVEMWNRRRNAESLRDVAIGSDVATLNDTGWQLGHDGYWRKSPDDEGRTTADALKEIQ